MTTTRRRGMAIGIATLLMLAVTPWLGWGVVVVLAALLLLLALTMRVRWTHRRRIAQVVGVCGGVVGAGSTLAALGAVGNQPVYAARATFGVLALALALGALVGALLVSSRPVTARVLLLGGSLLGFIAINLFYINTLYLLALPLCWFSAALTAGARTDTTSRGQEGNREPAGDEHGHGAQ